MHGDVVGESDVTGSFLSEGTRTDVLDHGEFATDVERSAIVRFPFVFVGVITT